MEISNSEIWVLCQMPVDYSSCRGDTGGNRWFHREGQERLHREGGINSMFSQADAHQNELKRDRPTQDIGRSVNYFFRVLCWRDHWMQSQKICITVLLLWFNMLVTLDRAWDFNFLCRQMISEVPPSSDLLESGFFFPFIVSIMFTLSF